MKSILSVIKQEIANVCNISNTNFVCEYPKNKDHGDFATNIAMVVAKELKQNPISIAESILPKIQSLNFVKEASIAKPGFINILTKEEFLLEMMQFVYESKSLENLSSSNDKINIEYVSANPTGPLHIGHLRGAIYGDVLANLLIKTGFEVTKEYYINDGGNQINILGKSVWTRYEQLLGKSVEIEEGCYPAEYIIDIAKEILENYGADLEKDNEIFKNYAINFNMNNIKSTLKKLKIQHDTFSSEKEIVNSNAIIEAFAVLEQKALLYYGIPPKPVKMKDENWQPKECLLFKSTQFGDLEDRVVQKNDKSYTYCVPDMVYNKNKITRGFNKLIMVLGADHIGYITRLKAMTQAFSQTDDFDFDIKICQIVKFLKNDEEFKMSKRAGNFVTVDDILEYVNVDIIRFMLITKKNDIHLDFDIEKVKEQSKENPIWYIQYAYSRLSSILRKSSIQNVDFNIKDILPEFLPLVKKILEFPSIVEISVKNYEPHHLAFYGYSLASILHSIWTDGNQNPNARFLIENNHNHNQMSINIILSTKKIFDYIFEIFNIEPLTSM